MKNTKDIMNKLVMLGLAYSFGKVVGISKCMDYTAKKHPELGEVEYKTDFGKNSYLRVTKKTAQKKEEEVQ